MGRPVKFTYEKKFPSRDAFYFIIVCKGQSREPDYFRFFEGMSSRVTIVPVESELGNSSPEKLINNAIEKERELGTDPEFDRVWFVIDTDRWRNQIHQLRQVCGEKIHWLVAQSNPCFEVWLYFHAKSTLPVLENIDQCNNWKPHLPLVIKGGFSADYHPVVIETAAQNAQANYIAKGYLPEPGSTQLWMLSEELLPLIKKDLDRLRHKFPEPEIIGS